MHQIGSPQALRVWGILAFGLSLLFVSGEAFASPAKITMPGSFSLSSTATLEMEIGGDPANNNSPVTFDQIIMTGSGTTFTVGGSSLRVILLPGIVKNSPYPIIKAMNGATISHSQVFSNLSNGTHFSSPGVAWQVTYSSTEIDVTFTAIPEPASFSAVLMGMIAGTSIRPRSLSTRAN